MMYTILNLVVKLLLSWLTNNDNNGGRNNIYTAELKCWFVKAYIYTHRTDLLKCFGDVYNLKQKITSQPNFITLGVINKSDKKHFYSVQ